MLALSRKEIMVVPHRMLIEHLLVVGCNGSFPLDRSLMIVFLPLFICFIFHIRVYVLAQILTLVPCAVCMVVCTYLQKSCILNASYLSPISATAFPDVFVQSSVRESFFPLFKSDF